MEQAKINLPEDIKEVRKPDASKNIEQNKEESKNHKETGHMHVHEDGKMCSGDHSHQHEENESKTESNDAMLKKENIQLEKFFKDPKNREMFEMYQKKANLFAKHDFWNSQPIVKWSGLTLSQEGKGGEIEKIDVEKVRKNPYTLPEGFEWANIDILNQENSLEELYIFLEENYYDPSKIGNHYTKEFIYWTFVRPNYLPDLLIGVRISKTKKLVAFLGGNVNTLTVDNNEIKCCQANFLCILKKLRGKRLTPVLIKELVRRCNLKKIFQGTYSENIYLPMPICEAQQLQRPINVKKMADLGLLKGTMSKMDVKKLDKVYNITSETKVPGFRPMRKKDCKMVLELLNTYQSRFKLGIKISESEISHLFKSKKHQIYSFVVENEEAEGKKTITDFVSFYIMNSFIPKNEKYQDLKIAHLFYYAFTKTHFRDLIHECLLQAKSIGADCFNALNIMDNKSLVDESKFEPTGTQSMIHMYNWSIIELKPEEISLIPY